MFQPEKYFNKQHIEASDFYSPDPPSFYKVHPNQINLSGGRPNSGFYPIESINLNIRSSPFNNSITEIKIPFENDQDLDITNGLQYAPAQGHPQLLEQINQITQFHEANPQKFHGLITSGSGDSLNKVLQTFADPNDTILVENYSYAPIFATFEYNKVNKVPVPINFENKPHLDPKDLDDLLKNWSTGDYKHLKFPKFIYTVPLQNPSGLLTSPEAISDILQIVEKYDLLIIEDDPDGFIRHLSPNTTYQQYKSSLQKSSYLSTSSPRVLHLGTFSKTISPGIRLGYIVAHPEFIKRLIEISKTTTKAPSGFSQLILENILTHWSKQIPDGEGIDGYLSWTFKVSQEYTKRSESIFEKFPGLESVKRGWIVPIRPQGGMFFIIKIPNLKQPEFESLRFKFLEYGVQVILGKLMSFDKYFSDNADFIRLTLANVVNVDELVEGITRLDKAVVDYFKNDFGTDFC